ncbi:aromatic ring-hydroxylating oxygenase subunit alpha [Sphingomonas ginsenosidimutans]|jgi:phenylpropionate dioxygenase-like ring-hydroxylating dioxygenase large terminal subunit|uniref:aromatic ring-hydroxylating oxygenase subunit alpha n=1 Tax=Sphingomonas ginsenosidimutans TaxID=862134 RepID=UPI000835C1A1|nr:aromatic ring-hydroxylating dioxygenase subunit alpha [Sphingomonas ginsenosidimutans]MBY0300624.1 aromatic ring-hydroxylating dioxygenase subunit alpha [Sphingomonas ginsenosidimutans]
MNFVADIARPAERRVTRLSDLTDSQQEAIRRIPAEKDAVNVPLAATRPNAIFTGRERFDAEQANIFQKHAVPVALAAVLPEPGSVVAIEAYGKPLLVTRTRADEIKVFINACQHKGAKLVEDCAVHKQGRMVCPYHAWTYGLDGKLIGVARSDMFEGVMKDQRGLKELPSVVWGGVIYAQLNGGPLDVSQLHDQIDADFTALGIPGGYVYGRKTFDLAANWKVVLEPFLEGYHVQRLHAASIGALFVDAPSVSDTFGVNIRQVSGRIGYEPAMLDEDADMNVHKLVTHAYTAFPNVVVVTSQYYTSVMILMPYGVDRTVVHYYMVTPGPATTPKAEEVFERSYDLIIKVFAGEDFRAAQISQEGLNAGVPESTVYCGLEENVIRYYEALETLL